MSADDEFRDFLTAIHDALDPPRAATAEDHEIRIRLMGQRLGDTKAVIRSVLGDDRFGAPLSEYTAQLREWVAEHPVTYTPWQPTPETEAQR